MAAEPLALRCQACGGHAPRVLEQESPSEMLPGVRLEVYQCAAEGCARRTVVVYEPAGGIPDDRMTFVEREVMRHGSFFPSDYGRGDGHGPGGGMRRW